MPQSRPAYAVRPVPRTRPSRAIGGVACDSAAAALQCAHTAASVAGVSFSDAPRSLAKVYEFFGSFYAFNRRVAPWKPPAVLFASTLLPLALILSRDEHCRPATKLRTRISRKNLARASNRDCSCSPHSQTEANRPLEPILGQLNKLLPRLCRNPRAGGSVCRARLTRPHR